MTYPRPAYRDPDIKSTHIIVPYSNVELDVPVFDHPIPVIENFRRNAARDNPRWSPNSFSDVQSLGAQDVVTGKVRGMQIHTDFRYHATGDYTFKDWFNTDWTWVQSAGGAMLTPGTQLLSDISRWKDDLEFPNLDEWDFDETAARFTKNEYDPEKALLIDIGRGCTERLVSLLGGYTEGMLAMATQQDDIRAFLDRYSDFVIELFDRIHALYPIDMVTYHDDWGTERDTFFSEKMMEELVFEPTKRIIDHIRAKGVAFELHSCGNITRFLPYMVNMGADFLQIQRRAVNIPDAKAKYGDRIGFNTGIEGLPPDRTPESAELIEMVRNTVELYGAGGGFYASVHTQAPKTRWEILAELFAYSREYYERERRELNAQQR
jgi:hypothetical protein